ncbi:hypothetical protein CIB48_g12051 [Xylaria polymorpha]|nr:hypothetical protein CIB48_g12051 [Xylaria polymorpha]
MSLQQLFYDARNPPANPVHLSFKDKAVLVTGARLSSCAQVCSARCLPFVPSGAVAQERAGRQGHDRAGDQVRPRPYPGHDGRPIAILLGEGVRDPPQQAGPSLAGVAKPTFVQGPERYEIATQANVLSPALMALLLLPKLREIATSGALPHLCFVNIQSSHLVKPDQLPIGQTLIERLNDSSQ